MTIEGAVSRRRDVGNGFGQESERPFNSVIGKVKGPVLHAWNVNALRPQHCRRTIRIRPRCKYPDHRKVGNQLQIIPVRSSTVAWRRI